MLLQRNNQNIRGVETVIILGKGGRKMMMATTIMMQRKNTMQQSNITGERGGRIKCSNQI